MLVSSTLNRSPSGLENSGQNKISETKIVKRGQSIRQLAVELHRLKNAPKLLPRSGARQKKSHAQCIRVLSSLGTK